MHKYTLTNWFETYNQYEANMKLLLEARGTNEYDKYLVIEERLQKKARKIKNFLRIYSENNPNSEESDEIKNHICFFEPQDRDIKELVDENKEIFTKYKNLRRKKEDNGKGEK